MQIIIYATQQLSIEKDIINITQQACKTMISKRNIVV